MSIEIKCSYDELVSIKELKPHPKNPNSHSEAQIARLGKILSYQGFRNPIIVSRNSGYIVSGHGRLLAAQKIGLKKVPINYQDFSHEDQEYAHLVADNAISEWAKLNLEQINLEVPNLGPDFEIDLLGLNNFEIEPADKYKDKDADEVLKIRKTNIKLGDLFQLGNHRLLCGDSTDSVSVERLMNCDKANMVYTDPPYNVQFNGRTKKFEVMANDDLSDSDFDDFIQSVCKLILSLTPDHYYVWCNWKFYSALQTRLPFKACIVWAKNNFGLGSGYRHQHEFCLFNGTIDDTVTNESDLWNIAKDVIYQHPTQKPVALAERALKNHCSAFNVVDLFAGSGSTLIACEKTNRKFLGIEIDPKYCQVIIDRWEKFTGQKAVKI